MIKLIQLTEDDKNSLIQRFPKIKLCYESNIDHNKVSIIPDYYTMIPKGKKIILWTTYFKDTNLITFAVELNKGEIIDINHIIIPTIKTHSYGTVFYGTCFNNNKCFSIENIHYYNGQNTEKLTNNEQMVLLVEYMSMYEIERPKYNFISYKIGIPYMSNDNSECIRMRNLVPYPIYCIQHKRFDLNNVKVYFSFIKHDITNITSSKTIAFEVRADPQNDVYHCYYGKESNKYSTLYIPDIKTSVMMNRLFRIIKENDNLDTLEESDDEDEFENIEDTKFLIPNKTCIIECSYNPKFKKWFPVKLSNHKHSIESCNYIQSCETKLPFEKPLYGPINKYSSNTKHISSYTKNLSNHHNNNNHNNHHNTSTPYTHHKHISYNKNTTHNSNSSYNKNTLLYNSNSTYTKSTLLYNSNTSNVKKTIYNKYL